MAEEVSTLFPPCRGFSLTLALLLPPLKLLNLIFDVWREVLRRDVWVCGWYVWVGGVRCVGVFACVVHVWRRGV